MKPKSFAILAKLYGVDEPSIKSLQNLIEIDWFHNMYVGKLLLAARLWTSMRVINYSHTIVAKFLVKEDMVEQFEDALYWVPMVTNGQWSRRLLDPEIYYFSDTLKGWSEANKHYQIVYTWHDEHRNPEPYY